MQLMLSLLIIQHTGMSDGPIQGTALLHAIVHQQIIPFKICEAPPGLSVEHHAS